jgi:hypothetical protein
MNLMHEFPGKKTGRIPAPVIYSFLWLFFLAIPVITNNTGGDRWFARISYDWLRISPFLIVFLVNSMILLPRILFRGSTKAYLLILLLFIFGLTSLYQVAGPEIFRNDPEVIEQRLLRDPQYGREEMRPGMPPGVLPGRTEIFKPSPGVSQNSAFQFINIFIISLLIAGFNTAIAMTNKWIVEEQARREVEKEHIRTELAFLQNQVSPHFFMNTLNNIHSLIEDNTELAQDSILKLSALMRYLLYESGRGTTTLKKESDFIRSYVNLMQLRYDKSVSIKLELPHEIPNVNLPPLLFVSFIENAFKHGISYREPASIYFSLKHNGSNLEFLSVNSMPSHQNSATVHKGIGLENIRKRLNLLYKDDFLLDILNSENEFRVRLEIPAWISQDTNNPKT